MSDSEISPGVSPIEEVLQDYRDGKMVILVDDEDRENEGDLVIGAGFVTAGDINFMAAQGSRRLGARLLYRRARARRRGWRRRRAGERQHT